MMSHCQSCRENQQVLSELQCGHYLCGGCVKINTNGCAKTVNCPFQGKKPCSEESSLEKLRSLQFAYKSVIVDSPPMANEPTDKIMDEELIRLARDQGIDKPEKDDASGSGDAQSHASETENDVLYDLMNTLSEKSDKCVEIRGFYESCKGDKIVIDIDKGTQKEVSEFLTKELGSRTYIEMCTLLEQEDTINFLVNPGAKVTLSALYQNLLNSHPDALHDTDHLATVTCLGEDTNGQLYILTAKHIFGNGSTQPDERGFMSNYHSKLTEVSDSLSGILDVERIDYGNKQWIDIAALPLTPSIQQGLLEGCPELMYDLKRIYTGEGVKYRTLRDRVVFKHGAITGNTCGRITYPQRSMRYRDVSGYAFFIESNDKTDPECFAKPGDSGSLIWDKNGVPIGLVFASINGLRREDGSPIPYVTCGVRLDYCLKVLNDKTGIDIVNCRAVGSPIPVVNEPGNDEFYMDNIEGAYGCH